MTKKSTSSAYTPAQKAKILSRAQKLLSEGKSFHHTAQKVGVHRQTLKRWLLAEARKHVKKMSEELRINRESTEETVVEPVQGCRQLSWEEVRELCKEHELCNKKAGGFGYSEGNTGHLTWAFRFFTDPAAAKIDNLCLNALKKRMAEIKEKIGIDAIHEYRDRKATRQKIEEAEERCNERIGSLERKFQQLGALTGLSVGFGIGAVLFSILV